MVDDDNSEIILQHLVVRVDKGSFRLFKKNYIFAKLDPN